MVTIVCVVWFVVICLIVIIFAPNDFNDNDKY